MCTYFGIYGSELEMILVKTNILLAIIWVTKFSCACVVEIHGLVLLENEALNGLD